MKNLSNASKKKSKSPDGDLENKTTATIKPDFLPNKFWDEEKGTVRLQEMAKSYGELEKQHSHFQKQQNEKQQWQAERQELETNLKTANDKLAEGVLFAHDWQEKKNDLCQWAENIFGSAIVKDLINNEEGVRALHFLRQGFREPSLMTGGALVQGSNEAELRRLMRSPRYWRDKKPDVLKKVEKGFDRLYGK